VPNDKKAVTTRRRGLAAVEAHPLCAFRGQATDDAAVVTAFMVAANRRIPTSEHGAYHQVLGRNEFVIGADSCRRL
jgi:roadblock/LC7 domain-containing protein